MEGHDLEGQHAAVMRIAHLLGLTPEAVLANVDPAGHAQFIERLIASEQQLREEGRSEVEQHLAQAEQTAENQARETAARIENAESIARESAMRAQLAEAASQQALNALARADSQQPRQKPIKLSTVPFSGRENENLRHWELAVSQAASAQLITDEPTLVTFALSRLTGKAREWAYSRMLQDSHVFPTWARFVELLREAFQPPDVGRRHKAKLLAIRQGKRTLHDFIQEMRYLRAATADDPLSNTTLVTIFMEGLRPGAARNQLFRAPPRDVEDAFKIALNEEHSFKSAQAPTSNSNSHGSRNTTSSSNHSTNTNGATPMEISSVESETRKVRCFNCGKTGHVVRQCRAPRKKREENGSNAASAKAPVKSGNGTPQ